MRLTKLLRVSSVRLGLRTFVWDLLSLTKSFASPFLGGRGCRPSWRKAPYLPRIAQIRKENALYAPDETLTGFVSTPGIAYLYTVSTSIDEKFYVALSEPTQRRDQLDKSAHLLVQVTASLSRQLHFRDCEDKPCKVRGGICHRRVP